MSFNKDIKIITIVGMTGAGKSEVVDYITAKGYPKVYFGGVFYDAMRQAGIEIMEANEKIFRAEIREREGTDFLAKRIIKQIHDLIDAGQHRIVIDGLYSWSEYKILKHEFPGEMIVTAVLAPRKLRYHRLANRPERPRTEAESSSRDWSEIETIEKGGPIAIADHFIINNDSIEKLHQQIDAILDEIDFLK